MDIIKSGVISDAHIPFHNPRALELSLIVFEDLGIDEFICLGDGADIYNLNSHQKNKHPDVESNIEDEINATIEFIDDVKRRFPKANLIYHVGNHLHRVERYVIDHCPSLLNYLRLKNFIDFEGRGWEIVPYNRRRRYHETNLYMQHSPASYSVNLARTNLLKYPDISAVYGCAHRKDYAMMKSFKGIYEVFNMPWLGGPDISDENRLVFSYMKGHHEHWPLGFGVAYAVGQHDYEFDLVTIHYDKEKDKYWCIVSGHYYEN